MYDYIYNCRIGYKQGRNTNYYYNGWIRTVLTPGSNTNNWLCFDVDHNTSIPHLFLVGIHSGDENQASRLSLLMRNSTYLHTLVCVIFVHKYKLKGDVRRCLSDVIGTLPPAEIPAFVCVITISCISYRFIAIFGNEHEIIYNIIHNNSYFILLNFVKKNFFSNKIINTLKITIEICTIGESISIIFEYYLL